MKRFIVKALNLSASSSIEHFRKSLLFIETELKTKRRSSQVNESKKEQLAEMKVSFFKSDPIKFNILMQMNTW